MTVNGRKYRRADVVRSAYDRTTGYLLLTFHDGTTVRVDASATLVA